MQGLLGLVAERGKRYVEGIFTVTAWHAFLNRPITPNYQIVRAAKLDHGLVVLLDGSSGVRPGDVRPTRTQ